jgi:ribonuclease HII
MMLPFDETYTVSDAVVLGMDEVGRGCLAGPVYSCCVFLEKEHETILQNALPFIDDSKKLNFEQRKRIALWVAEKNIPFSIGAGTEEEIDCQNILLITQASMQRAIDRFAFPFTIALIDGAHFRFGFPHVLVPKGDRKSLRIALASNLAKYYRDSYMINLGELHPEYGFAKHKGYATKEHINAIKKFGILPVHRMTFFPVYAIAEEYVLREWKTQYFISDERYDKILRKKEMMKHENGRCDL